MADVFLPQHLCAHKYFFVCTLTVAAWDTLVLSPRSWRLLKTHEWSALKAIYLLLRYLMPIEFIAVGMSCSRSSSASSRSPCIPTSRRLLQYILVFSRAMAIRLHAIYDKNPLVTAGMGLLLLTQIVVMATCCAFYWAVPLTQGQGCIAGPRHNWNWVGIYWLVPTIFFTAALGLAIARSVRSLRDKPLGPWKLLLRDGLNLYATIWVVNIINMLFWFIARPTDSADTIKTIVTSMATVLTVTMTMRIILNIKGTLNHGGSFQGQVSQPSSAPPNRAMFSRPGDAHGVTGSRPSVVNISAQHFASPPTGAPNASFTLEEMRAKAGRDWDTGDETPHLTFNGISPSPLYGDEKDSFERTKVDLTDPTPVERTGTYPPLSGVQVTIDREIVGYPRQKS
ncbi:hypothetical protein BOTBODRAFT_303603 [Botryobasidium botryosum FD-172 SS1]|uniref:DUF6533 domain-containing protein n=1 Tax=Botryobasidium botryosum (strain FD-172 SS1) TaxID=930990 RepID=A0A067MU83_BOTB1|nr:hypothetical protein BOTBODRAFT_303603 [Botryobasidium botryosum FD-172 SS1]